MKIISNDLKEALKKDIVTERDYIILTGTTDRIYLWFKLYDDCYKDGNVLQNFIMKRFEFEYFDSDIDFRKKEFKAYKEYKLEDGTWEAIDYGTFIVAEIEESDTKEKVKVTAYDYALKFANVYVTELDYTSGDVTLLDVWNEACDKCGVATDVTSFTNSDFIVDSNQFENTAQFGNVISAISGVSGNFAKIVDDKVTLRFTNETDVIIEKNEYDEFEDKRDTHPITIVGLGMSNIEGENVVERWEDGILEYGENYMMINDNPFAYTQDKRQQLLPALYSKLKGFAYSAMTLKNCLHPELECGDLIKVRNNAGQLIETIVLRPTYESTNIKLEAPSITKAIVEYSNPASALTIAKRTEIIVNKQAGTITQIVEEQTEHTTRISKTEQDVESINQSVKRIGGNNKQQNSVGAFGTGDYEQSETGTILALETDELKRKTESGRAIVINSNKWLKMRSEALVVGQEYTLSFKYSNIEFNSAKIKLINNTETVLIDTEDVKSLEKVEYTFIANTEFVELLVETGEYELLLTDYYLQTGNIATTWQPAPAEAMGQTLEIYYNGIKVTSDNSEVITQINNLGFTVMNKNGKVLITANKDKAILSDTEIQGTLVQGHWKEYVQTIGGSEYKLEVYE